MNDLRTLTANTFAPLRSRQADVVAAVMLRPAAADAELAELALCSVKTVRKWRPTAHLHALVCRDKSGARFTVRLKKTANFGDGGR